MTTYAATLRAAFFPRSTLLTRALLVLVGAGIVAICAQISIPLPFTPVPVTGQTFAVVLVGVSLGPVSGALSLTLYLLAGIADAPVYADGAHGFHVVTSATGGYLLGFVLAASLTGALAARQWDRRFRTATSAMLAGNVVIYVVGLPWLAWRLDTRLEEALELGLYPFVVGDVLKLYLERRELASGSTSRAAGGVRAQFSDPLNIAIGLRSLEAFARFGERPGGDIELKQVGYLFLLDREEDVHAFERSVALQNELGVPSRLVTLEEAARLNPIAGLEGVLSATYCPLDGTANPEAAVQGYVAGARAYGATVVTGCEVTGIEVESGEIRSLATDKGTIATGTVVCAAGVWSPALAELVGRELPVEPVFREVGYTVPVELPPELSFTVDFSSGLYFHCEGPGLLFGMADPDQEPGLDAPAPDPGWLDKAVEVAARRLPSLLEVGIAGGWRGYYDMSPDFNALIGEFSEVSRFLYATGFSGHGFMQGPAVGEIVRDLVLAREPFVDVSPLSVERFVHGTPRPEHNVI